MKPSSPIKKFGIPVLVIVVIGALVYFLMSGSKDGSDRSSVRELGSSGLRSTVTDTDVQVTSQTSLGGTTSNAVGGTIVQLLQNIGSLTLPVEVLDDPAFAMFSDGSVSLPPRNDPGRRNPFSALSGSGNATSINPTAADSLTNKSTTEIIQNPTAEVPTAVVEETKTTITVPKSTTTTTTTKTTTKKQN